MTTIASSEVLSHMNDGLIDKKNGYKIVNIVFHGSYEMASTIDLKSLAEKVTGARKEDGFSGLVWKKVGEEENSEDSTRENGKKKELEKWTMLLFKNGKFVLTGIKKMEDAGPAVEEMRNILVKEGHVISRSEKHVTNLVSNGAFPHPVDLNSFILKMENSRYKPEVFPGLIYYDHGTTFLVFSNGKYICLGAKVQEKIGEAVDLLDKELGLKGLYRK